MKKIAFVFPGQGANFNGMGKTLYEQSDVVRRTFEEANDLLNIKFEDVCFKEINESYFKDFDKLQLAHLSIFITSVATYRAFIQEVGYVPELCMGHSLGEYIALTCSDVFSFKDSLNLIKFRAGLASQAAKECDAGMTIINKLDHNIIEREIEKFQNEGKEVYAACYNTPFQIAISGRSKDLNELEEVLAQKGGKVRPIAGSAPFHSPLMSKYAKDLADYLSNMEINQFKYPVISNVTSNTYKDINEIIPCLKKHLTTPVRWTKQIELLKEKEICTTIEMSPKKLLTNLIKQNSKEIDAFCFGDNKDRDKVIDNYKNYKEQFINQCLLAGTCTPNLNDNCNNEYNIIVGETYNDLKNIKNNLLSDNYKLTDDIIKASFENLKKLFSCKNISIKEQEKWFNQILEKSQVEYKL